MDEDLFTQEEESLIDNLKAAFYNRQPTAEIVKELVAALAKERRAKVINAALIQVSAEQAQRRRYVVATLLRNDSLDQGKQDSFVSYFAEHNGDLNDLPAEFGLSQDELSVGQEQLPAILEQAKIFAQTDQRLENFSVELLLKQRVNLYFNLLKNLTDNQLSTLLTGISSYLSQAERGRGESIYYNPELPKALVETLAIAKMGLSLNSFNELAEKVQFLTNILYIAQGILDNRSTKALDDNALQHSIGQLFYLQGVPISFDF